MTSHAIGRVIVCVFFLRSLSALISQGGRLLEVLIGNGFFLLLVEPFDFLVNLLQVRRTRHRLEMDSGTGFIDHVNSLVGQDNGP